MAVFTFPGDLSSLETIAQQVMLAAAESGLNKKAAYRLRLAVDEIATNIITHGYAEAGLTGDIEMQVQIAPTALTIILEDTAPPYTPNFDQSPAGLDLSPEERPIGGLGLYLAAQNVDQLSYTRLGDRNRHTVVVNRPWSA